MKILFLQDDFPPISFGGAGISTYELALGMKDAGHDVFVITTVRDGGAAGESKYDGLTVFKIVSDYNERWRAWMGLYNPRVIRQVEKLLKEIQPDVVHANNIHFHLSYACLKVAKKYAKAVVWTARDTMSFTYGKLGTKRYLEDFDTRVTWRDNFRQAGKRWNPLRNFCIKRYLTYADKLFAVSDALRKALEQNGIRGVEVVHTGADVDAYHVSQDTIAQFRKKYRLLDKKVVLFSGRLSEAKGGKKALEALAILGKEIPEAVVLVAGSIDAYAQLMRAEADVAGIGEKLVFTGWIEREEMKTAYAVADIVLVPSLYLDPFPRVAIEAMAAGKAVIGTRYGGAPEIIVDGVTGYVVDPFDVKDMAEKVISLFEDREKAERFGRAACERVHTDFGLGQYIEAYLARYEQLLA